MFWYIYKSMIFFVKLLIQTQTLTSYKKTFFLMLLNSHLATIKKMQRILRLHDYYFNVFLGPIPSIQKIHTGEKSVFIFKSICICYVIEKDACY